MKRRISAAAWPNPGNCCQKLGIINHTIHMLNGGSGWHEATYEVSSTLVNPFSLRHARNIRWIHTPNSYLGWPRFRGLAIRGQEVWSKSGTIILSHGQLNEWHFCLR
jgi:hypothetical protein